MCGRVEIRSAVIDCLREQTALHLPQECCGLLAGSRNVITHAFPTANALASAREYFIDPAELIRTLRNLREHGLIHRGIYHSHPSSQNIPSPRDIEMAFYPSCAYFIISPRAPLENQVRAFRIQNGRATEMEIGPV